MINKKFKFNDFQIKTAGFVLLAPNRLGGSLETRAHQHPRSMKSQRSLAQCIQSSGGLGEEVAARHFFTLVTAVQAKREEGVRW
jgi:hypothetical protein